MSSIEVIEPGKQARELLTLRRAAISCRGYARFPWGMALRRDMECWESIVVLEPGLPSTRHRRQYLAVAWIEPAWEVIRKGITAGLVLSLLGGVVLTAAGLWQMLLEIVAVLVVIQGFDRLAWRVGKVLLDTYAPASQRRVIAAGRSDWVEIGGWPPVRTGMHHRLAVHELNSVLVNLAVEQRRSDGLVDRGRERGVHAQLWAAAERDLDEDSLRELTARLDAQAIIPVLPSPNCSYRAVGMRPIRTEESSPHADVDRGHTRTATLQDRIPRS